MTFGLRLGGVFKSGAAFDYLTRWFQGTHEAELLYARKRYERRGGPALCLKLHPVAPEIEIEMPDRDRIAVLADTSALGTGYHVWVCEMLRAFGENFGIVWDTAGDDTGYFHHGRVGAVEEEMLASLRESARAALASPRPMLLSMPTLHEFRHEHRLLTLMGPRDDAWLNAVAADPTKGIDAFPWWRVGQGAECHRGRALARMWTEVRWRAPLIDEERETLSDVARSLERARTLDPGLVYPYREWDEILGFLDEEGPLRSEIARLARDEKPREPIGYRRREVRVELPGGFSFEIPGRFAEEWEDGETTFSAWAGGTTFWYSLLRFVDDATGKPRDPESIMANTGPADGEPVVLGRSPPNVLVRAGYDRFREDGEELSRVSVRYAVRGALALVSIVMVNPKERDLALTIARSVRWRERPS